MYIGKCQYVLGIILDMSQENVPLSQDSSVNVTKNNGPLRQSYAYTTENNMWNIQCIYANKMAEQ